MSADVERAKRTLSERGATRADEILDFHSRGYSVDEIVEHMPGMVSKSFVRRVLEQSR